MTSDALPATVARPGGSRTALAGTALARPALAGTALARTGAPDFRRCLELALAGLWLLDALLQFQAVMFTTDFARMIEAAAAGGATAVPLSLRLAAACDVAMGYMLIVIR